MRVCFDDMDAQRPVICYHRGVDVDPQNQERSVFSDGDIIIPRVQQSEPLGNQVEEFLSACRDNVVETGTAADSAMDGEDSKGTTGDNKWRMDGNLNKT